MYKKLSIFVLVVILFLQFNNNYIQVTNIVVKNNKVPEGLKIVHLSDLHNKRFGKNQRYLIYKVNKAKPDIIILTGDLVDRRKYDEKPVLELIKELVKISPIYYVTGNHENWSANYKNLEIKLKNLGVNILHNSYKEINIENSKIYIAGIDDPSVYTKSYNGYYVVEKELKITEYINNDGYKILLSHRPELFRLYNKYNFDLVFSGHAHGGQIRIPFIGGIIAPNQGFFLNILQDFINMVKHL